MANATQRKGQGNGINVAVHGKDDPKIKAVVDSDDESDSEDSASASTQKILTTVRNSYKSAGDNDHGALDGRTMACIESALTSKANACLVCLEVIKKIEPIWCCETCHTMFHIGCIQRWVKDGVYQQTALSEENFPKRSLPWFCPKCRHEYQQSECPTQYRCFCTKVTNPPHDPWLVPHSCGQQCDKLLKPDCGHKCLLLCHPGPCPPCPQMVRMCCHCRRCTPQMKRCGASAWSCGQVCGQVLACGQHKCSQPCHAGPCLPCAQTSVQPCLCGRNKSLRACAEHQWQCTEVCGRPYACGSHKCEKVCHRGNCGPCPRSGPRHCPCGKTAVSLPCTEEVPTCEETCDRMLTCGSHRCTQRCHLGPCGTCREMTNKVCRCGKKTKVVQCYKDYQCDTKCANWRDCGKHQCKKKCCDGSCAPCEQQCGKTLSCKSHKCASLCHRGPCYPCSVVVRVACPCGLTVIEVPCGRQQLTKPPRCNKPCKKPSECHHAERLPHRCHAGDCPPCSQICDKQLIDCDHRCPARCHTAVKTRICEPDARQGPWQQKPVARDIIVEKPCPPCQVPMPVTCLGQHETALFPCSQAVVKSCGRPCGRQLACSNHTCQLPCHTVKGATNEKEAGVNCQSCEEGCERSRPDGCTHPCPLPCHPGTCPPCTKMLRMRCHCQLVTLHVECDKWVGGSVDTKRTLQSCGGLCPRQLACSHQCKLVCHDGPCRNAAHCEERVKVKCPCRRRKVDVACREVQAKTADVACDATCLEQQDKARKEKEAEMKAAREAAEAEERRKKQNEEEVERKREEKKRKKRERRERQDGDEDGVWHRYGNYFLLAVIVLIVAVFAYYLLAL